MVIGAAIAVPTASMVDTAVTARIVEIFLNITTPPQ